MNQNMDNRHSSPEIFKKLKETENSLRKEDMPDDSGCSRYKVRLPDDSGNRNSQKVFGKKLEKNMEKENNDTEDYTKGEAKEESKDAEDNTKGDAEEESKDVEDNTKGETKESNDTEHNTKGEVEKESSNTDDTGKEYKKDGELLPNITYNLNGNKYTTDSKGRIISVEAKPTLNPDNKRDSDSQQTVGDSDRRENDQGGHIVGRDMNGDSGIGNIIPMDAKINQSDYKRMENEIKRLLAEGKTVKMKIKITYTGDSKRPDKIKVTFEVDGKIKSYTFDNNLDNSLMKDVPDNGKKAVEKELKDTKGVISSIKKQYDENGNLVKTTVNITYKDENGVNHRTKVEIDNTKGEK